MASLGSKTRAELQRQMNQEMAAAYIYEELSFWCEEQNLTGFARYFLKQAGKERQHARLLIDHLHDRRVPEEFVEPPAPRTKFRSLLEVAKAAQSTQEENTRGINSARETAMDEGDDSAQIMLDGLIDEQEQEEDWCAEMVDRVEKARCSATVAELDRYIQQYRKESAVLKPEAV